jgi:hypothetical protein
MCCASLRSLDRGCSPPQAREQSLAAFHESLEALRRAIRTEQEDTITGIIERLEPLRQGIEERQESLSWAAKRLADDKLAAVERQQRHVEQLLEGVRRGDASSDALSYPLVPCTDSNFLCLPEVAEAAAGIQTLGSACGRFFELAMEGGRIWPRPCAISRSRPRRAASMRSSAWRAASSTARARPAA